MPLVVGVAFKPVTKVYYFDPADVPDLQPGERVVVETARGRTLGEIVYEPRAVPGAEISGTLKPVVRRATVLDMVQQDQAAHQESEALAVCKEKVAALGLNMKVIRVEYNFDSSSVLVYFTSEQRVDFRNLVHELAQALRTRVEMRQIGVRDEAKFVGGFGRCGRELCCASWLREFAPVSIKMAKQQDLPLNPTEISGVCGRLLCCLSYENDFYAEARTHLPKINSTLMTAEGPGKVRQVHVLRNSATVLVQGANDSKMFIEVPLPASDLLDGAEQPACPGCAQKRALAMNGDQGEEPTAEDGIEEARSGSGHVNGQAPAGEGNEPGSPAPRQPNPRRRRR